MEASENACLKSEIESAKVNGKFSRISWAQLQSNLYNPPPPPCPTDWNWLTYWFWEPVTVQFPILSYADFYQVSCLPEMCFQSRIPSVPHRMTFSCLTALQLAGVRGRWGHRRPWGPLSPREAGKTDSFFLLTSNHAPTQSRHNPEILLGFKQANLILCLLFAPAAHLELKSSYRLMWTHTDAQKHCISTLWDPLTLLEYFRMINSVYCLSLFRPSWLWIYVVLC